MKYNNLIKYGLTERFIQEATLYEGLFLARVTEQHRDLYKVVSEIGELQAGVSGNFIYRANDNSDFPAVGDWVMIDRMDDSAGPVAADPLQAVPDKNEAVSFHDGKPDRLAS